MKITLQALAFQPNWPQLRRAPNKIWSVNSNVCQHQYYDNNNGFFFWTNIMSCHQQWCYLPIFCLCSLFAFLHGHVTAILTSREWYASSTWTGVLFQLAVKSHPRPHVDVPPSMKSEFVVVPILMSAIVKIFRHWVFYTTYIHRNSIVQKKRTEQELVYPTYIRKDSVQT